MAKALLLICGLIGLSAALVPIRPDFSDSLPESAAPLPLINVDPSTSMFVEPGGRVRIFHGLNAVYKIAPFYPNLDTFDATQSIAPEDIANLRDWGITMIRLGVMWPGWAPNGEQDDNYVAKITQLINSLAAAGIHTLVDVHQDVFAPQFCGEGVPPFLVTPDAKAFPFPLTYNLTFDPETKLPTVASCLEHSFFTYYLTQAVSNMFQQLYSDTNGLQTRFQVLWANISSAFAGNTAVLGYELINEPWAGDVYKKPELLIGGKADVENLAPMYATLHDVIRRVDDEHLIFYEKALIDEVYPRTGFITGPGGPAYNNRQVYSYHVYCAPTDSAGSPSNLFVCNSEDDLFFVESIGEVKRLGAGGMMTEFGAMPDTPNSIEALEFLVNLADRHLQSWAYWQFKYFHDVTTQGSGESLYDAQGNVEPNKLRVLTRSYAPAIAGTPVSVAFKPSNGDFTLVYKINTTIAEPTIVYLNTALFYANGFNVDIQPAGSAVWSVDTTHPINFYAVRPSSTVANGAQITLTVKAA